MKRLTFSLLAAGGILYAACNSSKDAGTEPARSVYLDLPGTTYQYYNDKTANDLATLGRVLFYERNLSVNASVSCGSCHRQSHAFADDVAFSRGFQNHQTGRNTPTIQDFGIGTVGFGGGQQLFFWDGRSLSLQSLVGGPVTNHVEMGLQSFEDAVPNLQRLPYYPALFQAAYGDSAVTTARIANALSYFMKAIRNGSSRFDAYVDNTGTLSAREQLGLQLFFTKYNCGGCHNESIGGYAGNVFSDIGLDGTPTDLGRGVISGNSEDNGQFKIPNLRNIALSAPYMHDGRFKTLDEVLDHYSHGINQTPNLDFRLQDASGQPMKMNITTDEKQAIIAFLNTLTDPALVTNPYFSDPFKTR